MLARRIVRGAQRRNLVPSMRRTRVASMADSRTALDITSDSTRCPPHPELAFGDFLVSPLRLIAWRAPFHVPIYTTNLGLLSPGCSPIHNYWPCGRLPGISYLSYKARRGKANSAHPERRWRVTSCGRDAELAAGFPQSWRT